ncbi:MAG TPA: tetratricopeptide repeat protein [Methylocystis sp.]|nr:tetratricopeptide repeat protein [Methylocystis sp.]
METIGAVGRVGSVMKGAFQERTRARSVAQRVAALAALMTVFAAPAPALDSSDQRPTSPSSTQLPMFKDPRAALRAGLERYHAGETSSSVEALRYAADSGEPLAQWKLARMYASGDGVARDDRKAYEYYSQIVEHFSNDDPDPNERVMASNAFVALGAYLREGIASARIAPDPERAFDVFRYAATFLRNAEAQYNVARMYLEGAGVKRDVRQAVSWLEIAARKGHAQAQALLGSMMFNGEASGAPQRPLGLMYLTLAEQAPGGGANDKWIADARAKAFDSASEADRKAAGNLVENYLKRHD